MFTWARLLIAGYASWLHVQTRMTEAALEVVKSWEDSLDEPKPQPRLLGGEDQEDDDEIEEVVVHAPAPGGVHQ